MLSIVLWIGQKSPPPTFVSGVEFNVYRTLDETATFSTFSFISGVELSVSITLDKTNKQTNARLVAHVKGPRKRLFLQKSMAIPLTLETIQLGIGSTILSYFFVERDPFEMETSQTGIMK